jgi:(S)-ureidoglycine aminohydrolase
MKNLLAALLVCITIGSTAQTDSLRSGVYNWSNQPAKKAGGRESRQIVQGQTTDLAGLKIHTSTLEPGGTNHPLQAYKDREELIIVKDGHLKVTINDSSKILGPGSIVLIIAGDRQSFQNVSGQPATYCVLAFRSRSPVDIKRGREGGGSLMKDWKDMVVKKTDKGESRQIFDRPSSLFARFEVHVTALNPGFESHPPHTHRAEEIMLLMKGNVTTHIGEENQMAAPGDVILLTPNVPHNLKNTGNEQCWYYAIKWYN